MSLECAPVDVPMTIEKIGAFIVVVGGFVLQAYMTLRATKKINDHSTATTNDVKNVVVSAATGNYKVLPDDSKS